MLKLQVVTCAAIATSLVLAIFPFGVCAQSATAPSAQPLPPPAKVLDQKTVLYGVTVHDPYQWLEDRASPDTGSWIAAEQRYTEKVLSSRPGMDVLRRQLRLLVDREETHRVLYRRGRYFIDKKPAGQEVANIYVRDGLSGVDKLLVSAASISPGHTAALELLNVSPDGRILAYGLRRGGRDQLSIHFYDLKAARDLTQDTLPEARYLYWSLPMAPDDSGVYYVKFDDAGPRILHHLFGRPVADDSVVFGEGTNVQELLAASLSPDGNYLLVTVLHGASGSTDLYLKNLHANAPFQTVVKGIDATFNGVVTGHTLFIETNWKAGRGQLFAADVGDPGQSNWRTLIPEQPGSTMQSIAVTRDRLMVNVIEDAHSELLAYSLDGKDRLKIPLPGPGSVATVDADPGSDEVCFSYSSFQVPPRFYGWTPGALHMISGTPVPAALRDIEVKQVWYPSTGGVKVPMYLAYRRGLLPDSNLPVLLYGYGGFNWAQLPTFSAEEAVWLEKGGVYAIANIRGGNEFGEQWHRAGELNQKQNCFDDFVNAAKWLIANHYTRPQRLAIQGLSNGGLLVSVSITQHPELFGAAIGRYPLIDMIRYERFSIARWWISEYGSVNNADQFRTLYAYSPYHHVVKGTPYPAALFVSGDGDTRVDPSHARKMTAMLQSASTSGKPVLLLYDSTSGHSGSLSSSAEIEQSANELEFLNWQLHLPEASQ